MTTGRTLGITLAVLALLLAAGSLTLAAPEIRFDSEKTDFGNIVSGVSTKVSFTFTNVGDADLEIVGIHSQCGCTNASALEKKLAPGKSSKIEATFNSSGYSGAIDKHITVNTTDPSHESVSLQIIGNVLPFATMKPERVNFGSIKVNTTRTHILRVMPGDPKTFEITKIEPRDSHVTVPSFKKIKDAAGDYWELTILITAGATPCRVREAMIIRSNAGESAMLYPLVYGNIVE